jgi:ABC-type antimicrobial peptide transport system permease subunit
VLVLNESGARLLFPGGDALGQQVTVFNRALAVVGVVADFRHGPTQTSRYAAFVPFDAMRSVRRPIGMIFVVRPRGSIPNLAMTLRRAAEGVGARALVEEPRPGSAWFSDRVATPRHQTALVGLLAAFGLILALIGIFSTTAYAVARRTREIGVRMALGARPADVVRGIVRDAGWPVACGLAAGLAGAFYATRVIQALLYEVAPRDLMTFVSVPIVMAVVAMVAAWIPARRAARVNPVAALRAE